MKRFLPANELPSIMERTGMLTTNFSARLLIERWTRFISMERKRGTEEGLGRWHLIRALKDRKEVRSRRDR